MIKILSEEVFLLLQFEYYTYVVFVAYYNMVLYNNLYVSLCLYFYVCGRLILTAGIKLLCLNYFVNVFVTLSEGLFCFDKEMERLMWIMYSSTTMWCWKFSDMTNKWWTVGQGGGGEKLRRLEIVCKLRSVKDLE